MGVSGCGKTTVGMLLAERLDWPYAEADDLHPPANVARMAAGRPLTDSDRLPWLRAVAGWIDQRRVAGEPGVVTCSALKRKYRDRLRDGRPEVRLVHLRADRGVVASRLAGRRGHFFPANLLDSQYTDLEEPGPDEHVLVVPADRPPGKIVELIAARLVPNG